MEFNKEAMFQLVKGELNLLRVYSNVMLYSEDDHEVLESMFYSLVKFNHYLMGKYNILAERIA